MGESFEEFASQRIGANVWGVSNEQYDLARDSWYASRGQSVPEDGEDDDASTTT